MSTTVIYHRADYDGLFSGAVCKHFMPDAKMIGWDFGDTPASWDSEPDEKVFVVDLPPVAVTNPFSRNMVWIDHHQSSIEQWDSSAFVEARLKTLRDCGADEDEIEAVRHRQRIPGFRLDGVAACRLCWNWFTAEREDSVHGTLATKQEFVNHSLIYEPRVLSLVGEYDVWDLHDRDALPLQFGLTARGCNSVDSAMPYLSGNDAAWLLEVACETGEAAMAWQKEFATSVQRERSYVREFDGLLFCVLGSAHARNSMWFPEGGGVADALMSWRYDGKQVAFSLYHAPGHEDIDLSPIAVKYGGGGHKGACGFSLPLDQALEIIR